MKEIDTQLEDQRRRIQDANEQFDDLSAGRPDSGPDITRLDPAEFDAQIEEWRQRIQAVIEQANDLAASYRAAREPADGVSADDRLDAGRTAKRLPRWNTSEPAQENETHSGQRGTNRASLAASSMHLMWTYNTLNPEELHQDETVPDSSVRLAVELLRERAWAQEALWGQSEDFDISALSEAEAAALIERVRTTPRPQPPVDLPPEQAEAELRPEFTYPEPDSYWDPVERRTIAPAPGQVWDEQQGTWRPPTACDPAAEEVHPANDAAEEVGGEIGNGPSPDDSMREAARTPGDEAQPRPRCTQGSRSAASEPVARARQSLDTAGTKQTNYSTAESWRTSRADRDNGPDL